MQTQRTRSLTDMLSGLNWSDGQRGTGFREGRARSLFNDTALAILRTALAALAEQGQEALLITLAEQAATAILADSSCSTDDRRHAAIKIMDLFDSLPRTATAPIRARIAGPDGSTEWSR